MAASAEAVAAATKPLDWHDRSDDTKRHIDRCFNTLSSRSNSKEWLYQGSHEYGLCSINELDFIRTMIKEAPASQKEFWIIDIGAGDFQWSHSIAGVFPEGITVNIIGLRGEKNLSERVRRSEGCNCYDLGAIKIEELDSELLREGFDIANKVDLIVSKWTFRHLTDPTGTFIQAYNLLRPGSGVMMLDGFFTGIDPGEYEDNGAMMRIVMDTHALFLSSWYTASRSLHHFLLKRVDDTPCSLPMTYNSYADLEFGDQASSGRAMCFTREPQEDDEPIVEPTKPLQVTGDKELYEWLRSYELFDDNVWMPCRDKDKALENPPLHQAIRANEYETVATMLAEGINVNESDSDGNTPLHLSIDNERTLSLILEHTPLFSLKNKDRKTALDLAIDGHNTAAIETLIKAGARKVRWGNREALAKLLAE